MVDVELEESREMGEDGETYEPVTNRVTKWMMYWGKF